MDCFHENRLIYVFRGCAELYRLQQGFPGVAAAKRKTPDVNKALKLFRWERAKTFGVLKEAKHFLPVGPKIAVVGSERSTY